MFLTTFRRLTFIVFSTTREAERHTARGENMAELFNHKPLTTNQQSKAVQAVHGVRNSSSLPWRLFYRLSFLSWAHRPPPLAAAPSEVERNP